MRVPFHGLLRSERTKKKYCRVARSFFVLQQFGPYISLIISLPCAGKIMKQKNAAAAGSGGAIAAMALLLSSAYFILLCPASVFSAEEAKVPAAKTGVKAGLKNSAVNKKTPPALAISSAAAPAQDLNAVRKDLKDADHKKRRKALESLSGPQNPEKISLLRESLADEDPLIKEKAARLIGGSKDNSAFQTLSDALAGADKESRLGLMEGLGDLDDKRAVPSLSSLLADPDRNTRWKAAEVLGRLKADEGIEALLKAAVEDNDEFVKKASVESLGKIGTPKAAAALAALKSGKDEKLSRWADNVLKSLE